MAEKEYIERDKILDEFAKDYTKRTDTEEALICEAWDKIKKIPAADVVEVVRCKDCEYWGGVTFGYICRRLSGTTLRNETRESDYCSFGAKMDGKGEG